MYIKIDLVKLTLIHLYARLLEFFFLALIFLILWMQYSQPIFHERYFCGKRGKLKPWKDVARKINLSAQGCINIHDKAIKELSSKIDNEKIKF